MWKKGVQHHSLSTVIVARPWKCYQKPSSIGWFTSRMSPKESCPRKTKGIQIRLRTIITFEWATWCQLICLSGVVASCFRHSIFDGQIHWTMVDTTEGVIGPHCALCAPFLPALYSILNVSLALSVCMSLSLPPLSLPLLPSPHGAWNSHFGPEHPMGSVPIDQV